jgi:chemotaxis signal transduction protein
MPAFCLVKRGYTDGISLVIFELGSENYGVDIAAVEGIIKMQEITRLPHAPSFVEGITNLRGAVVPVVDLRKRFGLTAQEATRDTASWWPILALPRWVWWSMPSRR